MADLRTRGQGSHCRGRRCGSRRLLRGRDPQAKEPPPYSGVDWSPYVGREVGFRRAWSSSGAESSRATACWRMNSSRGGSYALPLRTDQTDERVSGRACPVWLHSGIRACIVRSLREDIGMARPPRSRLSRLARLGGLSSRVSSSCVERRIQGAFGRRRGSGHEATACRTPSAWSPRWAISRAPR